MCHKSLKLHQTINKVDVRGKLREKSAPKQKVTIKQIKVTDAERFFLKHEDVLN